MFAASKTGRAVSGATTDPYFPYVPLLLETGASSTRSTTVLDGAATPNTVTRNGTPSTGWTSPYQTTGYWSGYFNGTTASQNSVNPTISAIGTGNFTVEFFYYWDGETGVDQQIVDLGATGFSIYSLTSSANVGVYNRVTNTEIFSPISYAITKNSWVHIALVRSGTGAGQTALYINGTSVATAAVSSNFSSTTATIGCRYTVFSSNWYPVKGYVSNFRISNIARTITVPTAPYSSDANTLFLGLQSNRFIDSSGTALTVVGTPQTTPYYYPSGFTAPTASPGAGLFNGTADYLDCGSSSAFVMGSGDWTVESWVYPTSTSAGHWIFVQGNASAYAAIRVGCQSNQVFLLISTNGTSFTVSSGLVGSVPINTWTHLAVTRSGATVTLYVNGTSVYTSTALSTSSLMTGTYNLVGRIDPTNLQYFTGYISNLRLVKGTAVYTGAFTPPSNFVTQTGGTYPSTTNVNTSIPAANTSLLLNLADSNYTSATNGVQNNTFIDSSNYAFPITRNGTPTQGAFTPYQPSGYWSGYFDGASALSLSANAAFSFSTGDFCIEAFVFTTTASGAQVIIDTRGSDALEAYIVNLASGKLDFIYSASRVTSAASVPTNQWTHLAVTRSSGVIRLFINGVLDANTATYASAINATSFPSIGGGRSGGTNAITGYYLNGYMSNFRMVKGSAVYTNTFTPSTTPLTAITNTSLLTLQSNRFIDNSSNAFAITVNGTPKVQAFQPFAPAASYSSATYGGSGYFNGSTDELNAGSNAAFAFGSGAYTVEFWTYLTAAVSASHNPCFVFNDTTGGWGIVNGNGGNQLQVAVRGGALILGSSTTLAANTWSHVVVVRSGTGTNQTSMFVNGTRIANGTDATNWTITGPLKLGGISTATYYLAGYLSNVRVVKGTAVYDPTLTTLTVPTTPLTAVSGTSLLTNFGNAGIYDAAWQNNALTVGDAQASTTQYKWSPTSMKFDGTGDYLSLISSPALDVNNGDFTIEAWVYPVAATNYNGIIALGNSIVGGYASIRLRMNSSQQLELYISSNGSSWATFGTTTNTISLNAWTYLALVRSGSGSGNVKLYINGTASSLALTFTGSGYTGGQYSLGCVWSSSVATEFWNGYIQDLRITKGVARTITTPTAAFPTR